MGTSKWQDVPDHEKFGVVVYTYKDNKDKHLLLHCGDTVHILKQNGDWYYGYCTRTRSTLGIFPKTYVHIKDAILDKSGPFEVVIANEPAIAQEISAVIREWVVIAKQHYVNHNPDFEKIKGKIFELIDCRKRIISGTLPNDELRELKQEVASLIDIGNWILHLDLVVRDEQGNILNPDWTSTVHLYKKHVETMERIKRVQQGNHQSPAVLAFTHSLYISVRNFVCKIGNDVQLLMSLYDAKEGTFISENYVVRWTKEGLSDLDQLNTMKVLFTDLSTKDLSRERVFFVCQVVRIGSMELKEVESKKSSQVQKKAYDGVRRPFGVAVMDISAIISEKNDNDEEKEYCVPFVQCGERDFLDTLMKKLTTIKEVSQREHKGQGLWVSIKLLHGDLKEVREKHPHLVSITTNISRKTGFPEVILPGDVRNDLYLTLVSGEFAKGAKTSDKNVEVTVKACNDKGVVLPGVISMGSGVDMMNEYCSVIYYHEDKPKWMETIKIVIPIEEFYSAHLLFLFKHRSSSEGGIEGRLALKSKDRVEKPFAMSFVKLLQPNGTTLKDEFHELLVYKVDHKKFDEGEASYLTLPSKKSELETRRSHNDLHTKVSLQASGLTLSNKDSFQISTLVCSTKLTQNVDLLSLLKWRDNPDNLKNSLTSLMKVDGEEIVKFLQDTLDALFNILMENIDNEMYDRLVFDALVFILSLIADHKYLHFRPVLDAYVEQNFSATLAYNKLMIVLKQYIDNAAQSQDQLLKTIKYLEYIFKFIMRSRMLFSQLNDGKGTHQFEMSLKQLLEAINVMMMYKTGTIVLVQAACLKYLPNAISDIIMVFDAIEMSKLIVTFINNIPPGLGPQKLTCIAEIVHGELFNRAECRAILLPEIIGVHVKHLMVDNPNDLPLCIKILSDILEVLHKQRVGTTREDISTILQTIFRSVVQMVIQMDRDSPLVGNLVAVLISILRQMEADHYKAYINSLVHRSDLLDFLIEILMVFTDLVSKPVYSKDWNEMIMLQNSVILKALRQFSNTIRDVFSNPFEKQVWNNFFHASICFLTQDALQLQNFSENKRKKILLRYHDMRRETGIHLKAMWFNLGQNKIHFVPSMVGQFLETTLVPDKELRKHTIPIFFDMMQCEFYSPKYIFSLSGEYQSQHTSKANIKGTFVEFEKEMITQLDALISGGRGDEEYKCLFSEIINGFCENHSTLHEDGVKFVNMITELLEYLLQYRSVMKDENKENRLSCTVNLMEFFKRLKRQEMFIRYLNKLCDLHVECDNYTEAAFALKLHTELLKWSDDPLPPILRSEKFPVCETQRELKVTMYNKILEYFDKGKMWEASFEMIKELALQYENEVFDYRQLSVLLQKMATFYDNIIGQHRPEPEYFRVAFYGKGFPKMVQNKVFVFRGKEYEKLDEFSGRMQNIWPKAQVMMKLTAPHEDVHDSPNQYLQINKVDPVMNEKKNFIGKTVHPRILKYYQVNNVQTFTYSRPFRKGDRDSDNEFSNLWIERTTLVTKDSLPGILKWSLVKSSDTCLISPLENAIETIQATNKKIRDNILAHISDPNLAVSPLGMLLNGIVDAAVNGGIAKYEQAFFNEDYILKNDSEKLHSDINKLKDLIACQIPLLEQGIAIHKMKIVDSLKPFHNRMEACFADMKNDVEGKYGKRVSDIDNKLLLNSRAVKTLSVDSTLSAKSLPDVSHSSSESHKLKLSTVSLRPQSGANQSSSSSHAFRVQSAIINVIPSPSKTLKRKDAAMQRRSESQSQWYASKPDLTSTTPVIELKEELISQRPRRSEVEKRYSRPSSAHFRNIPSDNSSPSSTPGGGASMVSLESLEDDAPPPLPQKQSSLDYGNLPLESNDILIAGTPARRSVQPVTRVKGKPLPALPKKEKTPPPVPKKPSKKPVVLDDKQSDDSQC